MQSDIRQAGSAGGLAKDLAHRPVRDRRISAGCKSPVVDAGQGVQDGERDPGQVMHPPPGLCRRQGQTAGLEIEVLPPDTEDLADTKAGNGGEPDCGRRSRMPLLGMLQRQCERRKLGLREGSVPGFLAGALDNRVQGSCSEDATPTSRTG